MITTESKRGIVALMVAHVAGMLDLVALPVWVGTLISQYRFAPQQAGGLATLFLLGASLASMVLAPRFNRINPKLAAVLGFATSCAAFILASRSAAFEVLAVLHLVGGVAAGVALSSTHGTIGHAANPHRTFALAGLAIGIFGILFLGAAPGLIAANGGSVLFVLFAILMGAATLVGLMFFPKVTRHISSDDVGRDTGRRVPPLGPAVWFSIVAIALMCMTQAMTLSFFERVGEHRGFTLDMVTVSLVVYGVVTLLPAPIAALLERKVAATTVISVVPVFQAVFALIAMTTTNHLLYTAAGALMGFTIIFVHTFAFGLLARLDPTGRAVAGTPAMLMVGSACAPFLGGTLVQFIGFEAIGYAAILFVIVQLICFNQTRRIVTGGIPTISAESEVSP